MFFVSSFQGSTIRKRKIYEDFLAKVSILGRWTYVYKRQPQTNILTVCFQQVKIYFLIKDTLRLEKLNMVWFCQPKFCTQAAWVV